MVRNRVRSSVRCWNLMRAPTRLWTAAHGVGTTARSLGDVTGDGKADSIVFMRLAEPQLLLVDKEGCYDFELRTRVATAPPGL